MRSDKRELQEWSDWRQTELGAHQKSSKGTKAEHSFAKTMPCEIVAKGSLCDFDFSTQLIVKASATGELMVGSQARELLGRGNLYTGGCNK